MAVCRIFCAPVDIYNQLLFCAAALGQLRQLFDFIVAAAVSGSCGGRGGGFLVSRERFILALRFEQLAVNILHGSLVRRRRDFDNGTEGP